MAIASFVLGIVALAFSVCVETDIGAICGIVGIVFGAITRDQKKGKIGLILNIIAVAIGAASTIISYFISYFSYYRARSLLYLLLHLQEEI